MTRLLSKLRLSSKNVRVLVTFFIVIAVGLIDYASGYEISFAVFYLLAIAMALWCVGCGFAITISALSIISWLVGDWAAGATYRSPFIPAWNAAITMAFYLIVVWLLSKIKSFQRTLETRVRERTAALTNQMAENEQLEKEILEISDREQRRFGHDLHDGLCQHLLGAAIAGQVLARRLESKSPDESGAAGTVVRLIEEAILMARNMAHGLSPLQQAPAGLVDALNALAISTRELYGIDCAFRFSPPAPSIEYLSAIHLYRIAQESISNAVRHGHAKRIEIQLSYTDGSTLLSIRDNGSGLLDSAQQSKGMGLRIMRHRASMIGADFNMFPLLEGGVIVNCSIPSKPVGLLPDE